MSILLPTKRTRRTALRAMLGGGAVTVALPFLDRDLDSGGKALASTGSPLPVRFGTWYWGMGHSPHAFVDKTQTTRGIEFGEETKALIPYKDQINLFTGYNMPLDGRSNYTHWTGWVASRTGTAPQQGQEIPGSTLDLLIADVIGNNTRFKTIDVSSAGLRDNYSARNTNSRAASETSPIALYTRLFGPDFVDPNKADFKPDPRVMTRKSVLSAFTEDNRDYFKTLGASDKARMDEYFTSIRQVENQLAMQLEKPPANEACMIPEKPGEGGVDPLKGAREMGTVIETHDVMAKLLAMAVACNQTKVFNMVFTDHFGNVRRNGETYTHHLLTHEEAMDDKLGYQPLTFWFGQRCMEGMATFIKAMSSVREGDGTLLDNCLIFATSETNWARVHTVDSIPTYLIGKAGGRMKTGYHVVGGGDPITRIGFTLMKIMGVPMEKWGTRSLETSKPITEIMT